MAAGGRVKEFPASVACCWGHVRAVRVAPPGRRVAVAAGMAGAALPDIDKPFWLLFGFPPFPMAVIRFHGRIQDEARHRFPVEAVSAGVFAAPALMLLRAGAKRRVSGR